MSWTAIEKDPTISDIGLARRLTMGSALLTIRYQHAAFRVTLICQIDRHRVDMYTIGDDAPIRFTRIRPPRHRLRAKLIRLQVHERRSRPPLLRHGRRRAGGEGLV